ncbi:MAG: hypothetical protein IIC09_02485, partial [Proteobacteria bacterium]|nr:hypothetical protein [Pseudomonadota bacterium]
MALLDYSFFDDDEEQPDQLDYSFMGEPEPIYTADGSPLPEARAAEPSVWDSVQDFFTGGEAHRAKASNELQARKIAAREGITIEEAYQGIRGANRPVLNPEGRPPIRALVEGTKIVGKQLPGVPGAMLNTVLRTIRGGDTDLDDENFLDKAIEFTEPKKIKDPDPNYETINEIGKSIGYSLTSLSASIGGFAAATAVTKNPIAGMAAAFTAGGTVAFRGQKDEFMDRVLEITRASFEELHGRDMDEGEYKKLYREYNALGNKYGAWEAIPESLSNLVIIRALSLPLRGLKGTRLQKFKFRAEEISQRYLATQASEQLTETATAWGQNRVDFDAGLTDRKISIGEAFRQQALPTAIITSVMTGGGAAVQAIRGRPGVKTPKPTGPPITDSLDIDLVAGNIKQEVYGGKGLVEGMMLPDPYGQEVPVELETGLPENVVPIDFRRPPPEDKKPPSAPPPAAPAVALMPEEEPVPESVEAVATEKTSPLTKQKLGREMGAEIGSQGLSVSESAEAMSAKAEEISGKPRGSTGWRFVYDAAQSGSEESERKARKLAAKEKIPGEELNALIDEVANEAATSPQNELDEPTEAQKEAGNYKKGPLDSKIVPWLAGMDIAIENPAGSKRQPEWPALKNAYGYFKRTEAFDGDEVDVFIGPDMAEQPKEVFVIDQVDPKTGKPDEHKVILGVKNVDEARKVYLANYEKGWRGIGDIKAYEFEDFKSKLKEGFFKNSTPGRKLFKKQDVQDVETEAEAQVSLTKADRTMRQSEAAKKKTQEKLQPDPDKDDLITFIRKKGGINVDIESDVRGRLKHLNQDNRIVGLPGIEQTGGKGLTLDNLAEILTEAGYLERPERGGIDKDALIELLFQAEQAPVYTATADEDLQKAEEEERYQAEIEAEAFAEEISAFVDEGSEFNQVDPETARLMSIVGAVDHDIMVDIASRDIPEADVQAALQEFIDAQKSPKAPAPPTTEPTTEISRPDQEAVEVEKPPRKEAPDTSIIEAAIPEFDLEGQVAPEPEPEPEPEAQQTMFPQTEAELRQQQIEDAKRAKEKTPDMRPSEAQEADDIFATPQVDIDAEPPSEVEPKVKKGGEWVSPFAKDEYKPGDLVTVNGKPGSVDFTDDKGMVYISLDGEPLDAKMTGYAPE